MITETALVYPEKNPTLKQPKVILLFLLVPHIMQIYLCNTGHYTINSTIA